MLSGSLTPCSATLLVASSRLKSTSSTSDEYNALLPPSATASEKSTASSSRHSLCAVNPVDYSHSPSGSGGAAIAAAASQKSDPQKHQHQQQLDHELALGAAASAVASGAADGCCGAPPYVAATSSAGRSAALERAYVHDVYEQCEEPRSSTMRPRVAQFLAALEPGSMVCDVGCGSGRYLNANPLCFTVGVDRCARLATGVREEGAGGEVALCDNLELPFRDESFDAVLSVAVVHHFATTERRVGAIRELARVLRIGGRVIITVWALEQKQRRFESQDVLIPWQQPKSRNSNFSDEDDDDDFLPPYHAYTEDSTNSSRSAGDGDSSSLSSSSPGESCYSFVRRAIQKLAGSRRRHPWFLDTWTSKDTKNGSSLDYEDAKDLPIELRRLEDFDDLASAAAGVAANAAAAGVDPPLSASLKSRSLGSILYPLPTSSSGRLIVRSRSSVPSLGGVHIPENVIVQCSAAASASSSNYASHHSMHAPSVPLQGSPQHSSGFGGGASTVTTSSTTTMVTPCVSSGVVETSAAIGLPSAAAVTAASKRPRLVKQKHSLCEEEQLVTNAADASTPGSAKDSRVLLRKQSSLNEELMAENRIRERERVKKRIQKQTSLNESHLTRTAVFSRKFQVMRDGLTTKLKSGTGSLERVTKSGLVKIMQSVKNTTTSVPAQYAEYATATGNGSAFGHIRVPWGAATRQASTSSPSAAVSSAAASVMTTSTTTIGSCSSAGTAENCGEDGKERRHSRESGSDSSKDSLQSDTSIESEDSFASVIFIPKSSEQQQPLMHSNGNAGGGGGNSFSNGNGQRPDYSPAQTKHANVETSSASSTAACLFTHRPPLVPTSPVVMPCPTPAHSPAPVGLSCAQQSASAASEPTMFPFENLQMQKCEASSMGKGPVAPIQPSYSRSAANYQNQPRHYSVRQPTHTASHTQLSPHYSPVKRAPATYSYVGTSGSTASQSTTATSISRIKTSPKAERITRQVVKNLPQIPKFRRHSAASLNYPIVRRGNSNVPAAPRLSSMELFNPATDDLDSDSSEPSSPDSIDSVISAFKPPLVSAPTAATTATQSSHGSGKLTAPATPEPPVIATKPQVASEPAVSSSTIQKQLLDADSSLDEVRHKLDAIRSDSTEEPKDKCSEASSAKAENDRRELVAFAERLSAQLLKEMSSGQCSRRPPVDDDYEEDNDEEFPASGAPEEDDCGFQFQFPSSSARFRQQEQDPYIRKLNGEIKNLHSLREELRERRLMLANLNIAQYQNSSTIEEEDESPRADNDDEAAAAASRAGGSASQWPPPSAEIALPTVVRESSIDATSSQDEDIGSRINSTDNLSVLTAEAAAMEEAAGHGRGLMLASPSNSSPAAAAADGAGRAVPQLESRPSVESWAHSNSTASLDSPSAGGSSTHHRYYHVFREGELDSLINHHVTSLHIVSSYYERASWCVVAEKVQVWSI